MNNIRAVKLLALIILTCLLLISPGCGSGENTPAVTGQATPTPTKTPRYTPVLAPGLVLYSLEGLAIGLPDKWLVVDLNNQTIDVVIRNLERSNPHMVPYFEELKYQHDLQLVALEPSTSQFAANIIVSYKVQLYSLEQYGEVMRTMLEDADIYDEIEVGLRYQLRNYEVLIIRASGTAYYPDGEPYRVEQKMAIIDHVGDRYIITLTCLYKDAGSYEWMLDAIIHSLDI